MLRDVAKVVVVSNGTARTSIPALRTAGGPPAWAGVALFELVCLSGAGIRERDVALWYTISGN